MMQLFFCFCSRHRLHSVEIKTIIKQSERECTKKTQRQNENAVLLQWKIYRRCYTRQLDSFGTDLRFFTRLTLFSLRFEFHVAFDDRMWQNKEGNISSLKMKRLTTRFTIQFAQRNSAKRMSRIRNAKLRASVSEHVRARNKQNIWPFLSRFFLSHFFFFRFQLEISMASFSRIT